MANNYQQFSEILTDLTEPEKQWIRTVLIKNPKPKTLIAAGIRLKEIDIEYWPDFQWELEDDSSLWIYGTEYGNVTHAGEMIRAFLARFRPNDCFTLTWSETCSKPRLSEFGGGGLFITAKSFKVFRAADHVARMQERFEHRDRKTI